MKLYCYRRRGPAHRQLCRKVHIGRTIQNEYGPGVKLVFEVLQGEHQGQTASRICSTKLSPKSNLFKFLQAFKGGKLEPGEQVDLLTFIGQQGMMVV